MKQVLLISVAAIIATAEINLATESTTLMSIPNIMYPSLTAADWDSDGDKDLLIGVYKSDIGKVLYYENTGNDKNPTYRDQGEIEGISVAASA